MMGKITGAKACVPKDSFDSSHLRAAATSSAASRHFSVVHRDNIFVLQTSALDDAGLLDIPTTDILKELLHLQQLRFQAYADASQANGTLHSWKITRGRVEGLAININLYGTREHGGEVGRLLSKRQTYLQHPDYHDADTVYLNPHVFELPDDEQPQLDTSATGLRVAEREDSPELDVEELLDRLTTINGLKSTSIDKRITTKLLE